jgi:hypothetical protein
MYAQPTGMAYGGGGPLFGAPNPASAPAPQSQKRKKKLSMRSAAVGRGMEDSDDDEGVSAMAQRTAAVDAAGGTMSATLRIDGTSDIECDGGAHKVSWVQHYCLLDASFPSC